MNRSVLLGAWLIAFAVAFAPSAAAQGDADRLRAAKTLFFDKKYAEARQAWAAIQAAGGPESESAAFWVARCSESLQERERALAEYGDYLKRRPADAALVEEARTSRVSIATQLYRQGKKQHLAVVQEAVSDPSRTVRYFAALQLASLGPEVGAPAIPVLKKIVAEERDEDLVDRAKLGLLKLDQKALAEVTPRPRATAATTPMAREAAWVRVRVYERGRSEPKVQLNVPVALAELVFKSLPDEARRELRRKGYDADNFWDRLKKLGPTDILEIVGEDGERIKIWIE